ncbi:substrate-binding domain-containing protein (plasmid) [Agrobacterium sp. rho-13.3]|uniref:substrate-binding domain-containing protein n=1 Tax=Agrobacterium sp. rho-13.3 TaxID=3072980 RepID=UPI003D79FBC5
MLKGITSSAAGTPGVVIKVSDAKGDPATQIDQLKTFVADKVDAIIIGPADGDLGLQISKLASDAGIPMVYVNNQPIRGRNKACSHRHAKAARSMNVHHRPAEISH